MVELTQERSKFIVELIKTGSTSKAAANCHVKTSTAYGWLKRPEVKSEIRKQRQQRMFSLNARLSGFDDIALATIKDIMLDDNTNPQTRLQAAEFILKYSSERYESDNIERRLEMLEQDDSNRIIENEGVGVYE